MAIALFDKFLNTLPITVLEAKDISMVIMIDPPEGLPPSLLAGKGILDTEAKTISVYNSDGSSVAHTFDISTTDLQPLEAELAAVKSTAEDADSLSKTNASLLVNALVKDEYGWDVDNLSIYNVSRLSRTNNSVNSSGLSIGDNDVNLHGDTVGITSSNSATTYAVFTSGGLNLNDFPLTRLGSGGDNDTNAATIGDVKRISTDGSGLKPTNNEWDMLNLPVINVGESNETTSAATVGQVNIVSSVASAADTLSKDNATRLDNLPPAPDLTPYIKTGDEAELTSVSFTTASEIHFRPESGLVLTSDSLCGEDLEGNKTFIVKDGEFNVKSKVVKEVSDGVDDTDAVNKKQLNQVETKVDDNTGNLSTLATSVAGNTSEIAGVKTTAGNADTLSKANATRLDNLPPDPTPRVADLEENALQKDENGYDAKSFKILNLDSGEDVDTNAANIGDVKRISTSGSGLKPTDNEWDMLNLPVIHVQESAETDSAATVGQVNTVGTVASAADTLSKTNQTAISNLSATVGNNTSQISTNTSDISGIDSRVSSVEVTASAADTLSKDNKTRLDNLPPAPDLNGYVKNGDDVNFGTADIDIVKVTKGDDPTKFSDILIDSNTNTEMNFVGDTHFYVRNKSDNSQGLEAFQIDSSGRFIAKQKVKTPVITNTSTGTTNSSTDKAGFVDLSQDNETKIGAKNSVIFDVGGNLSAGIYSDNVNFNTDYVTGVKMREESSRQPYDAVNWQTLQSFTPNLDEYAKLDESVQFSRVNIKNDFADDTENPYFWCDPANGNTVIGATGSLYFNQYDHDGVKHRWALVDASNRMTLDNATKVHRLMNKNTWSTDSSTDKAGFIRWDMDNRIITGAKQDVTFQVNGKDVYKVKETGIDFTGLGGTALLHHDHNIDVSVGDTKNVAFKSNGMKILSNVDGDGHTINHSGDINFNSGKKISGNAAAGLQLRNIGALYRGDGNGSNIQFDSTNDVKITGDHIRWFHSDGHQYGGISNTGINLRDVTKIVGLPQGSADTDATNLGHIKELIAAGGGGGVDYENYIVRSTDGSKTFYETTEAERNAWVVVTNNNAGTLTYTFDYSRSGQEVVAAVENKTKRTIIVRMQLRQSTVLTVEVPKYSVFTTRYVPDIGHYVYNIGTWYPTDQRVITLDEINPTLSSDYKQMTKNIIAAMPNHTTLIGYHNPDIDGASKYKFVTTGKTGTGKESSKCAVVIHKHTSNHAVGLSTTEGSSGRVYSRVLDGTSGIWNTNDTSASFSLQEDIPLDSIPEDQIFFTGDNGVLESYIVNEETNEMALRPLEGYNIPKHESDIAALEVQTEKNRSQTHYFINEGSLSYDWPDEARKPLVEVQVLNTMQQINNSSVTVTDNDEHIYSGEYNTVGSLAINSLGNWDNQYVYHNAYKHVSENYYVVFNQGNLSWQIIQADNPHTSIGQHAASVTVQLGGQSSLPETFGSYTIDTNFDNIDSLEFITAEVPVQYDDINSRILINFNGAKPSGYVVLK